MLDRRTEVNCLAMSCIMDRIIRMDRSGVFEIWETGTVWDGVWETSLRSDSI